MLPRNTAELSQFLGNFITVANANLATLGLTAADITALTALKTDLDAKIVADTAAREAALAASEAKQTAARNAVTAATPRAKMILANPAVPNALKEQLGMKLPRPASSTPPTAPNGVRVAAAPNGVNTITWEANGNTRGTQYLVQQKTSQSGPWQIVGAATARKFAHPNRTPARNVLYRVVAQRAGQESAPSVEAVAYGNFPFATN